MFVFILWKLEVFLFEIMLFYTESVRYSHCEFLFKWKKGEGGNETEKHTDTNNREQEEKSILMIYFTNFCSLNSLFFHPEQ